MQALNELLHYQSGPLRELIQQSNVLKRLNKKFMRLLPDFLATECHVVAWEEDTVIIHANNGAVGTALRYQLLRLLPLLQQEPGYHKIQHLICHIRPAYSPKKAVKVDKPQSSTQAAKIIAETAENITDPDIQAALLRLAQHVQPKEKK